MIKKIINNWIRKLRGQPLPAAERLEDLRKQGMKIGKGTVLFSDDVTIDTQRPWMVEIGEYCKITQGVVILQHDYSRSVLRRVYGEVIGESQKTVIGDNVFIGVNSIILMGSQIGDNVIIGAGSVVSGNIPNNVVVAGNPAKVLCNLDEYYQKRKELCLSEAVDTYISFRECYHRSPTLKEMGAFWQLFMEKDLSRIEEEEVFVNLSGDEREEILRAWLNSKEEVFPNYEAFQDYAEKSHRK